MTITNQSRMLCDAKIILRDPIGAVNHSFGVRVVDDAQQISDSMSSLFCVLSYIVSNTMLVKLHHQSALYRYGDLFSVLN